MELFTYCDSKNISIYEVKEFYCNYATWKVTNKDEHCFYMIKVNKLNEFDYVLPIEE